MTEYEREESQASEPELGVAEAEDVEALKQALAEAKAKAEENLAGWQRAQADFINYKRRTEQEKQEISNFANARLVLSLLPVLDDFDRAFAAVPPQLDNANWIEGIRLVERKLRTTLEAQGLSQIKAQGEPFDPNLHEAVRQNKGKEGIVVEEVQKGYRFRNRVIRQAKVVVGHEEEKEV